MKAYSRSNKDNAWRSLESPNLLNIISHQFEHSANSLFVAVWGWHQHDSSDKKLGLGFIDISWMGSFGKGNLGSFGSFGYGHPFQWRLLGISWFDLVSGRLLLTPLGLGIVDDSMIALWLSTLQWYLIALVHKMGQTSVQWLEWNMEEHGPKSENLKPNKFFFHGVPCHISFY